ncbi:hypothetical protein N4G70_16765 [Streptomyces sp. ASQP_92]|uniref:hypothetical protein n=1 Tax=Streptomyces sp. ASQP_92 TaxID=2979116 RepID=UPI0021C06B8C|nr:hypothetical protein [Streptomyces sp. ASQP_92]MCT9090503.1 hypothetical protein [Streptomyces sp. ASQP_92]
MIWIAAVVLSAGLLAPPLFFIAAKKRLVTMAMPAIYGALVYGSAFGGSIFGNPKNWVWGVLTITLIVATVHAATLDTDWKADQ